MPYGNPTEAFLQDRQLERYRSQLEAWVREVASQSTPAEAFCLANQPPIPGSLIRDQEDFHRSDWDRAHAQVEEVLTRHVDTIALDDPDFFWCQASARRLWHDIWNRLEGMRLHDVRRAREEA